MRIDSGGDRGGTDGWTAASRRRLVRGLSLVGLLMVVLLAAGAWPRLSRSRQIAAAAEARRQEAPAVTVAKAARAPVEAELVLPGTLQGVIETAVFARADGYVTRRLADIGDRVSRGQLLAEIDSPELDQQIREAEAARQRARAGFRQSEAAAAQAEANLHLADVTARRWLALADKGVLSRQDGDEKQAALDARRAEAAAAAANVQAAREAVEATEAARQRLLELKAFRQVRAPFAGVVTARQVDVGSLVSLGSSSSVRELFRLAKIDTLRVFVMVPQTDTALITRGMACTVEIDGRPGGAAGGTVTRTASAIDPTSRTLLTEIQIPNADGTLLPGSFATVRFSVRRDAPPVVVPSASIRQTDKGSVVAVVQNGNTVHIQPVTPGRDTGTQTEIVEGVAPGQLVVVTWTDAITEGATVKPLSPQPSASRRGSGGRGQ